MSNRVAVVGGGISRFDNPRFELHEELCAEAVREMLADNQNIDYPKDIDAVMYSYFSDHLAGQLCFHWIIHDYLGLLPKPAYRVESGGATPVDALINAFMYIKSGIFKNVLVVGWEKMSEVNTPKVNEMIAAASDTDWDFPVGGYYTGYYAVLETRHMHLYGETEEDLAKIAVKNHNNATFNPYAQWRSQHGTAFITVDDVFKSRLISWPYRALNCAMISDGGACMLLASEETAKKFTDSPVWITGVGLGTDTMRPGDRVDNPMYRGLYPKDEALYPDVPTKTAAPYPEMANFGSMRTSGDMAYKMAGIDAPVKQLDFAELFNPYDGVELAAYEDLRFCKLGDGKQLVREGVTEWEGELPCQLSGAQTAAGHPVGATSIAQATQIYWQLTEQTANKWKTDARALSGAQRALIQGHGGTGCQSGVMIFERG